jgi:hypothetical protein
MVVVEHRVAQPLIARTIGTVAYLAAISCVRPHGSYRLGITTKSEPA